MKTVLSFTPIGGKGREKVVLPSTPELQAGFYRLEGATASIRIKHVFDVQDVRDILRAKYETQTCTVKVAGIYANITPADMMAVLFMVVQQDKTCCASMIQDLLTGCSQSRALEIAEDIIEQY